MLICDTHADTLYALADPDNNPGPRDITKANLLQNPDDIRIQAMALYVCTGGMDMRPTIVERELSVLQRLKQEGFVQITQVEQAKAGRANILLTIEGGEAFGDTLGGVDRFAQLGVRIASLIWNNENKLAFPAVGGCRLGLTPFGQQVVQRMRALRMAVDISHLNEKGSDEVMDTDIPPIATHSCCMALCRHPRNLTDSQIRRLIRLGGFIGMNFYPRFLSESAQCDIDRVVDHMVHVCDLGGEDILGLGSDFDGIELHPEGLRTAADLPRLFERMSRRRFDDALIEKIAGLNFRRYMNSI